MKLRMIALLLMFSVTRVAGAVSLAEYGVSLTQNGLIDHATGLRWLDSELTDGNLNDLQEFLDAGWRIASEEEYFYLVARGQSDFGGSITSDLSFAGMSELATRLSFDLNQEPSGPWLCRGYGDEQQYCQATDSLGGQFILNANEATGGGTDLSLALFISEVPMYGGLFCGIEFDCPYEGRALLVRAVPLPPAMLLLVTSLGLLRFRRR